MRKAIIGLSALVILSFIVLLFVNAHAASFKSKKADTEISAGCGNCPSAATCTSKTACCDGTGKNMGDPAKCKEMKCDQANCPEAKGSGCPMMQKTTATSGCGKSCPLMTAGK